VRLSKLKAGGSIDWHRDDFSKKTGEDVFRIHIPVSTQPENIQIIGHTLNFWDIGEIWLGDYRFPHKAINGSEEDRIHMIVDLMPNSEMKKTVDEICGFEWFGPDRCRHIEIGKRHLDEWKSQLI